MSITKIDAADSLTYFWEERGDIEKFSSFPEAIQFFPHLQSAWNDYKHAERRVGLEIVLLKDFDS